MTVTPKKPTKIEVGVKAGVVGIQIASQQGCQLGGGAGQLLIYTLFSSSIRPQEVAKRDTLLLKHLLYESSS